MASAPEEEDAREAPAAPAVPAPREEVQKVAPILPVAGPLPVRQYLDDTVVPVLRDALRALVKERPNDPFTFLSDFILAHRPAQDA